jgi:hypothetical protein
MSVGGRSCPAAGRWRKTKSRVCASSSSRLMPHGISHGSHHHHHRPELVVACGVWHCRTGSCGVAAAQVRERANAARAKAAGTGVGAAAQEVTGDSNGSSSPSGSSGFSGGGALRTATRQQFLRSALLQGTRKRTIGAAMNGVAAAVRAAQGAAQGTAVSVFSNGSTADHRPHPL